MIGIGVFSEHVPVRTVDSAISRKICRWGGRGWVRTSSNYRLGTEHKQLMCLAKITIGNAGIVNYHRSFNANRKYFAVGKRSPRLNIDGS